MKYESCVNLLVPYTFSFYVKLIPVQETGNVGILHPKATQDKSSGISLPLPANNARKQKATAFRGLGCIILPFFRVVIKQSKKGDTT